MAKKKGGLRASFKKVTPRQQRGAFAPFVAPSQPPAGLYDPSLDAEERAAERGYLDLQQDVEREQARRYSDFQTGLGNLERSFGDESAGLRQQIGYAEQDYGRAITELQREYQRLGGSQRQQQAAAGVRGGAAAQAAAKRAENEAFDRAPLDTNIQRAKTETWENALRLTRDYNLAKQNLGLEYQRGGEDFSTQLQRGGRELGFFKADTGEQRWFQAKQSGADLPTRPKNERSAYGLTFQVKGMNKPVAKRQYTLPTGRTFGRKDWVGFLQRRKKRGAGPTLYG